MVVPTSEVGYTSATTGRGDHEVHKGHVVALAKKRYCPTLYIWYRTVKNGQRHMCAVYQHTYFAHLQHTDVTTGARQKRVPRNKSATKYYGWEQPGTVCEDLNNPRKHFIQTTSNVRSTYIHDGTRLLKHPVSASCYTVLSESRCAIRLRYVNLVVSIESSWTSLPTPFISAQRLSERRYDKSVCE
jgi:hypothetical protein